MSCLRYQDYYLEKIRKAKRMIHTSRSSLFAAKMISFLDSNSFRIARRALIRSEAETSCEASKAALAFFAISSEVIAAGMKVYEVTSSIQIIARAGERQCPLPPV